MKHRFKRVVSLELQARLARNCSTRCNLLIEHGQKWHHDAYTDAEKKYKYALCNLSNKNSCQTSSITNRHLPESQCPNAHGNRAIQ